MARHELPLQRGLRASSHALDHPLQAVVLGVDAVAGALQARAGLFYTGVIAGCNCADDPSPVEPQQEYCAVAVRIDLRSGDGEIVLEDD